MTHDIIGHSDINLPMSPYRHTLGGQQSKAVEALPDLSLPSSQRQAKTETDDAAPNLASYSALQDGKSGTNMDFIGQSQENGINSPAVENPVLQAKNGELEAGMQVEGFAGSVAQPAEQRPFKPLLRFVSACD